MDVEMAVAVIDAAVELLKRDGWCQNTPQNAGGQRCLVGAICDDENYGRFSWEEAIVPALRAVGVVTTGTPIGVVPLWNDEPGRSIEDVFLALKQAKEILLTGGIEA